MATLSEIANKTNVSIGAVSRILNHDKTLVVSDKVRLSVFRIAHELGYKTPRQKRNNKDSFTIALADWHIIPPEKSIEYSLSSIASSFAFDENIIFTRLNQREEKQVDGIIALGNFSEEEKDNLLLSSQNIVFINSNKDLDYSFDRIIIDFDLALNEAVEYLKAKSNKPIAFIGGIGTFKGITIGKHRTESIKKLLIEKNLFSKELFLCGDLRDDGGILMENALALNPDGIIIASQLIEKEALNAYRKSGKNCEIILYRDIEIEAKENEDFPTIRMYTPEVWERATRLLIDGAQKNSSNGINIYMPAHLDTRTNAERHNIRSEK